jgi:uncharacterized protein YdbL (DUF1318 family)
MTDKELIKTAHTQGVASGQVALSAYLLTSYKESLPDDVKRFLELISQEAYQDIANTTGMPTEDVALKISGIVDKVTRK